LTSRPYITYPKPAKPAAKQGELETVTFVNEPGMVSFGVNDFLPGMFRPLHGHYTWEVIIVGEKSDGPGYVRFDGRWWRVDPGASVFVPKGYTHAWSAGKKGFKMLWVYGGTREEAGRIWKEKPEEARSITPEEEKNALVWNAETAKAVPSQP
jgi:quercetin dioxygenase-like cupin family protein